MFTVFCGVSLFYTARRPPPKPWFEERSMQTFPDRKAASQDYGLPNEEKHGGMSPKPNDGLFFAEWIKCPAWDDSETTCLGFHPQFADSSWHDLEKIVVYPR